MSDFTTYTEEQIIGRTFEGVDADVAPGTQYVALWGSAPANSPDPANEISGGSYSPVGVAAADWSRVQTGGPTEVSNGVAISFGELDAASDVIIEGAVVYDGSDTSTANALMKTDGVSRTVVAGDEFKFQVGDLAFSSD